MDLPLWTTHLIAFTVGIATWLPFTLWEGRRVTDHHQEDHVDPVPPSRRTRTSRLAVILVVTGLLMVGFGVQQGVYQHRSNERDKADDAQRKCIATYNAQVEQVRDDRVAANERLADARAAKDNAGDAVLLVVLDLTNTPQAERDAGELTRALVRFARKKNRLAEVQAATDTTLSRNPYPTLDCP